MTVPAYVKVASFLFIILLVFYFINLFSGKQDKQIQTSEQVNEETVFEEEPVDTSSSEYGLPKIPIYPSAAFVETSKSYEDQPYLYLSNWEVNDTVPKVMEWYVNKLSDGEWEIEKFPYDSGMEGKQVTIVSNDDWRIEFEVTQEDIGMLTQIKAKFFEK